jgi:hypothetical protein
MISTEVIVAWLEITNRRYSAEGVPHIRRPFVAMSDFTREHECGLLFDHPTANAIFQWFYERSPPGVHQVASIYRGVYFYDTAFWPVCVPVIFGEVSVRAIACLETMPVKIVQMLGSSREDMCLYAVHWANCMDYGYGHIDLELCQVLKPRALQFLSAAHFELIGANSQLLATPPNVKAILGMRMATEIFLKAVLVQERGFTDEQLRKISHNLEDSAGKCAEITGERAFEEIANRVSVYPPVAARYEDTEWSTARVWQATSLTQLTAATVTRLYTDQDIRATALAPSENDPWVQREYP